LFQTAAKVFIAMRSHIFTHSEMIQGVLDYARLNGPWQTRIWGVDDEFSARNFALDDLDGAIIEDRSVSLALIKQLGDIPTITCISDQNLTEKVRSPHVQINCDNTEVAEAAANFLLVRTSGALVFVNAPGNPPWSLTRSDTFVRTATDAGRPCSVWKDKHMSRKGFFPASFADWIAALPDGSAVLAANDPVARHILNICLERRIAVPEQLSILGVDDNRLLCETATPTLSSVALTTRETGFEAARLLERMMRGHVPPHGFQLKYSVRKIVERDSTPSIGQTKNIFVTRLQRFITDRLDGGLGSTITIEATVNATGMSRRTAETIFRRETGRTLHEEITRLRLKRALDLLTRSQDTLSFIAADCGFANASHLCRLFKAVYGKTPSAFRTTPTFSSADR
jgi:LacI family transcriptional regulator